VLWIRVRLREVRVRVRLWVMVTHITPMFAIAPLKLRVSLSPKLFSF